MRTTEPPARLVYASKVSLHEASSSARLGRATQILNSERGEG
jgi:hypothetical protein